MVSLDATIHFSRHSFYVPQPFKVGHLNLYLTCLLLFIVVRQTQKKLKICAAPAGIPTNTAKAAGYSVRMEASVPLVTQAPPIQPIQIRPGVITQVRRVARMGVMAIKVREHRRKIFFSCLQFNRPGPIVHSRSWCPLGSRWHQCPHHRPLWRLILWQAHRDWVTGGKQLFLSVSGVLQHIISLTHYLYPFYVYIRHSSNICIYIKQYLSVPF